MRRGGSRKGVRLGHKAETTAEGPWLLEDHGLPPVVCACVHVARLSHAERLGWAELSWAALPLPLPLSRAHQRFNNQMRSQTSLQRHCSPRYHAAILARNGACSRPYACTWVTTRSFIAKPALDRSQRFPAYKLLPQR
jgi:hypothetical protein